MRSFSLALLICFAGPSWADDLAKLAWIDCPSAHKNYDTCMKIIFPGNKEDIIGLNNVMGIDTVFEGIMVSQPNSAVSVSGGNRNTPSEDIYVAISCTVSQKFYAYVYNAQSGSINKVDLKHGPKGSDIILTNHANDGLLKREILEERAFDPRGYRMDVMIGYDDSFRGRFGASSDARAAAVMSHVNTFFREPSLGTVIRTNIIRTKHYAGHRWVASDNDIGRVENLIKWEPTWARAYVFMCYDTNSEGTIGIASLSTTCSNAKHLRSSLNEYHRNDIVAAETVAHEIGHNLGMLHDFDKNGQRYSGGKRCTGIMDYGNAPNVWSDCSRKDFLAYFNKVVANYGAFCLPVLTSTPQPQPTQSPTPQPTQPQPPQPQPPSNCVDFSKLCPSHANSCATDAQTRDLCKRTCGLCGSVQPPQPPQPQPPQPPQPQPTQPQPRPRPPNCIDYTSACNGKSNLCNSDQSVRDYCKRTCNFC